MFNTPSNHPKSQPFFDRVLSFSIADGRVWIRNFQIVEEDGALAEVGPRLTLNLIKIFDGSFRGECLFENSNYVSPNLHRRNTKMAAAGKYIGRVETRVGREQRKPETAYPVEDETDDIFRRTDALKSQTGATRSDNVGTVKRQPKNGQKKRQIFQKRP